MAELSYWPRDYLAVPLIDQLVVWQSSDWLRGHLAELSDWPRDYLAVPLIDQLVVWRSTNQSQAAPSNPAVQIDHPKNSDPADGLLACAGASRPTIKRPVGRQTFSRFESFVSFGRLQKSMTSSMPTMSKQSQIIQFRVVSS
jgi:hypothetical protein